LTAEEGRRTELAEALFNLASVDRLALLSEIAQKKQRLTNLSVVINASPQECSRHIARLQDSGLIKKNNDGLYEATNLGHALLHLLPSYEFFLTHKDYFIAHDVSFLPRGFLARVGELAAGEFVNHFSIVLELIKKVISTGHEYVWLISDQPMVIGPSIGPTFFSRNVPVRLIGQADIDRKVAAEVVSSLTRSDVAVLPEVNLAMAINEEIAGICFPDSVGKIDFSAGFYSEDPEFRGWCGDLFEHYWSSSRKLELR